VLYDQRGSFRSPVEDSSSVSLQRFVQDLEELRDELGIRQLTLLAHSRGPRLAWTYLRKHPEHVKRLVFVSPEMPTGAGLPDAVVAKNDSARQRDIERIKRRAQEKLAELGLDRAPDSLSSRERTDRWRVRHAAANFHHVGYFRDTCRMST
jgi:pimeloyl-ACP methyl ester carboxylesterase